MPKRKDISSILIIGAGPIIIGQACEFDYSGAQACKALKENGYRVILVNSNPATIMTDPLLADATYIEPIHWKSVEKIIEIEKPDAILPTMGGQTALNTALTLDKEGVLKNTNGCINDDIVASFNWEPVLVKPGDMVIFNALVPHRSGKNMSDSTRRIFYFTFNKLSEGIHYFDYFKKKREVMPPDIDRDPNKKYNTVNKYNLANPID